MRERNSRNLGCSIDEHDFVAVLFYKKNHKKSDKVLARLEEIDDDADEKVSTLHQNGKSFLYLHVKDVGFVKISDESLAYEYGLEELPTLVYYRKKIPIVYSGE